jgi:Fanconi anemia group M protein
VANLVTERNGSQQYFNHPFLKKDGIDFRLYQNNISEAVKNKNALVILPTALGKTIITVLVCAEFLYNYKSES